ncbi:MAG: MlaD family protein [Mariprofundaceae bacterium]|nr:MlaD family protein [Mariprofundaceae bacterium]
MVDSMDFVSGIKRQVGWFVMLGVGALILLVLIVSVRSNVFAKKFYLFVEPPSASSFYEGQSVKFQGFAIGHIDQIELQDEGQVRITLRLLERYRKMIHQGAFIKFTKEGLLGEQIVELTQGDISKPMLNSGEILSYETEASLEQLLTELKPAVGNANVLLRELAELSVWMNDPDSDLRVGMTSLRKITESVDGKSLQSAIETFTQTLEQLGHVASDLDEQKIALRLADSLAITTDILENIKPLSQSLGEHGPETIQRTNELLAHVGKLSSALNSVASDLSEMTPELPGLARDSRATLKEMQALMRKLQDSWLLGGGSSAKITEESLETAPPVLDMQP